MARPKQVTSPRVTDEVHAWLAVMSAETGLSVSLLTGTLLERAMHEGWTVQPLTVTALSEGER